MEPFKPEDTRREGIIARRESKAFTPDKLCMIYDALEKGLPLKVAAELAGILERTVYNWMSDGKRDEDQYEDGDLDHQTGKAEFYSTARRCVAKFVSGRYEKLIEAANDSFNWKANVKLLEWIDNELFGRKQSVTMDVQETKAITVTVVNSQKWMKEPEEMPALPPGDVVEGEFTDDTDDEES